MKKADFIGVWKLVEYGKGKIITSQTHLVVKEDILWEVHPNTTYYENQPGPEVKYEFKEGKFESKLSLDNGFKFLVRKIGSKLYRKLGPVYGTFPMDFKDQGTVGIYIREEEALAKELSILPTKVKVLEYKLRGYGTLKYDENLNWWTGKTKFNDKKIIIHISTDKENKFAPLDHLKDRMKQLKTIPFDQIATEKLLQLFNESWNQEDHDFTMEEFIAKITLQSITLESDNSSTIWFKDGDLFAGHSIFVGLDANNKVVDAGIMG